MGSENVEEDEIQHIVRISGTDLDGKKPVQYSLTGLKGVGRRTGKTIAQLSGVDPNAIMGRLPESDIETLKVTIESIKEKLPVWMLNRRKDFYTGNEDHLVGADLVLCHREDLNLMKKTRSYKGVRHEKGYRVRGQRTKSTGRRGSVVGVSRKKGK